MVLRAMVRRASKPGWIEGVALVGGDAPDGTQAVVLTGQRMIEARTRATIAIPSQTRHDDLMSLLGAGYCVCFEHAASTEEA